MGDKSVQFLKKTTFEKIGSLLVCCTGVWQECIMLVETDKVVKSKSDSKKVDKLSNVDFGSLKKQLAAPGEISPEKVGRTLAKRFMQRRVIQTPTVCFAPLIR
jgi:hypothetical protein